MEKFLINHIINLSFYSFESKDVVIIFPQNIKAFKLKSLKKQNKINIYHSHHLVLHNISKYKNKKINNKIIKRVLM